MTTGSLLDYFRQRSFAVIIRRRGCWTACHFGRAVGVDGTRENLASGLAIVFIASRHLALDKRGWADPESAGHSVAGLLWISLRLQKRLDA